MVAVNVGSGEREDVALRVLRERGAANIERADGLWQDGDWADFDPNAEPVLVDQQQLHGPGATR
jgi:hypothetical protein